MTDKQIIIDGINLHGNRKDLTGLKVGKLTCLKPVKTGKNKHSEWLCECECGNFKIAQTYRLLSGRIQSCGDCYHTINHYIPMIKELEKQLKAKEQECDRWQDLAEHNGRVCNVRLDKIDELEHDNNDLLEQLDQLKADFEQYKSSKQASYEEMQKRWNEVELENRKLKASLDEKNDLLQKLGISATGEFKRIKYYIDKLVAENEELKKEINNKYSVSNFNVIFMREHIHNLKQTLEQIKEIVKEKFKWCQGNKKDCLTCTSICSEHRILNLINEVRDA